MIANECDCCAQPICNLLVKSERKSRFLYLYISIGQSPSPYTWFSRREEGAQVIDGKIINNTPVLAGQTPEVTAYKRYRQTFSWYGRSEFLGDWVYAGSAGFFDNYQPDVCSGDILVEDNRIPISQGPNPNFPSGWHSTQRVRDKQELLEPVNLSECEACLESENWVEYYGGDDHESGVFLPYYYTTGPAQRETIVQSSRIKFGTKGCGIGCFIIQPVLHKFTGIDQDFVNVVTSSKGISNFLNSSGVFNASLGGHLSSVDYETNHLGYAGNFDNFTGSFPAYYLGVDSFSCPGIGCTGPGGIPQQTHPIYENSEIRDTIILDSKVQNDCPNEERYGDWINVPFPDGITNYRVNSLKYIYEVSLFENCEDAISLPCSDSDPVLSPLSATSMTTMAAVPGGGLMETAGPPLWVDLHGKAKAGLLTPEWIAEFTLRIPCGVCRSHWLDMLKTHPPRYDDQYAWSVEVHNVVNVRLGKPVWSE